MSLVSPWFFLFLLITFSIYFFAPQKYRKFVLLAGSYSFYFFMGGLVSLAAVNLAAFVIWRVGLWLASVREAKRQGEAARQPSEHQSKYRFRLRVPLTVGLTVLFGALAAVKYGNWLAVAGVSFYVFQGAGYLIDIYAGKIKADGSFFNLSLFLSFFPQLVQGPIARYSQVAGDLLAGHGWDWDRARSGVQQIIWGYFMKLVVADRCAVAVNTVFESPSAYGGAVTVFALFLYAVQVFGDFAGGIYIMTGIAEIVGVKLPQNFRQPFFAVSVADFWRRWHITLSTWLKDYLFYPIALSKPIGKIGIWARKTLGLRVGKLLPATVATFAVYFVMGIWHGASWQGFAFGLLNGAIISAAQFAEPLFKHKKNIPWYLFAVARTFIIMLFLRVFVRAGSMSDAVQMLSQVFTNLNILDLINGTLFNLGLSKADYLLLLAGMAAVFFAEVLAERGGSIFRLNDRAPAPVQGAALLAMLGIITVFGIYSGNAASAAFIYGQF